MAKDLRQLASLGGRLLETPKEGIVVHNAVESSLVVEVKEKQFKYLTLQQLKEMVNQGTTKGFELTQDGVLYCQNRLCVPNVNGQRRRIMTEAHHSRYSIHLGSTKMYHDLKGVYWRRDMKKDIAKFVAQCPNYQRVKVEHQKPRAYHPKTDGQAKCTIQSLEDMLRACVLDFKGIWDDRLPLIEFAYNNSYHSIIKMASYEALYGMKCRSPIGWFEVGETTLFGPDLVLQAMEKVKVIQQWLATAQI
ncbi:hypothetical protein MTR67_051205 [Solanum verrucosum]|uniref:Integrase zinc-binding domain-containing protein n=1 Tax=Solanum verrucosum TaxID=315347 RepID=A0AAF0V3G3_SOLVR|nr:hypothetical protein MTR67_051205 [Solanum verrucosum]